MASDDMDSSGRPGCRKKEQVVSQAQDCRVGRAARGLLIVRGSSEAHVQGGRKA